MIRVEIILTDVDGVPLYGAPFQSHPISNETMNLVYDALRTLPPAYLLELWREADPYEPAGALLRWQIAYAVEKKLNGIW